MSSKGKKRFPIVISAAVVFAAAAASGYLYQMIQHNQDSNVSITKAEPSHDDVLDDADVSLQYAGSATLLTEENIVTLNFTNPAKSKKSLSLEIVANIDGEDVVLAKTGKIQPGYKIDNIKYQSDRKIEKGEYKGKFIVYFYDNRGKAEIVNSQISINIHVK